MKILFVSSEVYPFSKTGGLADVSAGLPIALKKLGHDVRIITPAYMSAQEKIKDLHIQLKKYEFTGFNILYGNVPNSGMPVYFLDIPELYYRTGGPYGTELGIDWPDNAERFDALTDVTIDMAMDALGMNWKADIIHCNDWQTGLIPAKLSLIENRPATVFTIHNMSYLGLFSRTIFKHLKLPEAWWDWNQLEFHEQLSFLKAGILYADQINTVSPTYAVQILSPQHGYGMEGILKNRADRLSGILNGIDYEEWNPYTDELIKTQYNEKLLALKLENKTDLQNRLGLTEKKSAPIIGMVGRIVEQKGYDLVQKVIPLLMHNDIQVIILGSGNKKMEQSLLDLQKLYPQKLSVKIGYDEMLAHQIEAGSDIFLMPSKFEPCGLNQLYSLRYGTVPVVHHTGGLADSVIDTTEETLKNGTATGFKFYTPETDNLLEALNRALFYYSQPEIWARIQHNGMTTDVSWLNSAQNYIRIYQKAIECQGDTNNKLSV